jgi:hypothetical protein
MEAWLAVTTLVVVSSAGTYVVGVRRFGLAGRELRAVLDRTLECAGIVLVFCVVNGALAVLGVVASRLLTHRFVSLYLVDESTVLALSLVQGVMFQWWRQSPVPGSPGSPRH